LAVPWFVEFKYHKHGLAFILGDSITVIYVDAETALGAPCQSLLLAYNRPNVSNNWEYLHMMEWVSQI